MIRESARTKKRAPTARDLQREQTRARVYEAALEVFRRDGVGPSRIDDIARLAGVSRGTFYFHFPAKEDVLSELLSLTEAMQVDALAEVPADASIDLGLDAIAITMAAAWRDDPQLLLEVGLVGLRLAAKGLPITHHPVLDALIERMERAMARGEVVSFLPAEQLSQFFMMNILAAALGWVGNQDMSLEAVLRGVVIFFLRSARVD
jgi:AcrR family transcriptional regulator